MFDFVQEQDMSGSRALVGQRVSGASRATSQYFASCFKWKYHATPSDYRNSVTVA
jgi:hypothetical protein